MNTLAKILVVDNDPSVGNDLTEILTPLGYEVYRAVGSGEQLLENAIQQGYAVRPHVAIVDLRLIDDYMDETSGISLLKPFSSAKCILYSSHLTATVTRDARKLGAYEWLNKADDPELLVQIVQEAAETMSARQKGLSIHWPESWQVPQVLTQIFPAPPEDAVTPVDREVLDDVLRQLFPEQNVLLASTLSGAIVTITATSRARSFVMKIMPDQLEPQVVKVAKAADVAREVENYQVHVENRLGGHFHTRLERHVTFWDMGAALYSFLGTPLNTIRTFSSFYRGQQESEGIVVPLRHFFLEVWQRHYATWHALPEQTTLFDRYDEQFHLKAKLAREPDRMLFRVLAGVEPQLPDPIDWLRRHNDQSIAIGAKEIIAHGDLHGDNLFVSGQHAWVIDFERTGRHHALCDFAELEIDILTRLIRKNGMSDSAFRQAFVNLLLLLMQREFAGSSSTSTPTEPILPADRELRKAAETILALRRLAQQSVGHRDGQEYLWALLFDAIFACYMEHAKPEQRERAFLVAAVICEELRGNTNANRT